jgi:hypothetical protein
MVRVLVVDDYQEHVDTLVSTLNMDARLEEPTGRHRRWTSARNGSQT